MNKKIDITFIVAIYNVGQYLNECITSILKNKGNYEILLINDGSTDNSKQICDDFATKYDCVKALHKENGGVSSARNLGIEQAKGDWICFVDGDDTVTSDITTDILNEIKPNTDIVMFGFDHLVEGIIKENSPLEKNTFVIEGDEVEGIRNSVLNFDSDKYKHFGNRYNYNTPWGKLYKREYLNKYNYRFCIGIFRSQDSLFNFTVLANVNKITFVPKVGYHYRIISTSVSNKYNPKMQEYNLMTLREYDKLIKEENNIEAQRHFNTLCMKQLLYASKLNFCHKNNPKTYKERKKDFLEARNTSYFKNGYDHGFIKDFRLEIRPLAYAAKYNIFFLVNLMIKSMNKMKGR